MSAISAADAKAAVKRLQAVMRMGSDAPEELPLEVAVHLRTNISGKEHLTMAVDRLIHTLDWFPSVAQVAEAIAATAPTQGEGNPGDFVRMGCEACGYTGYLIVERGGTEYATECRCLRTGRMAPMPEDWYHADTSPEDLDQQRLAVRAMAKSAAVAG